ncbi:MAG: LamG-like jellyroll fold domain-containing protein [Candidatus Pacearchaeota archaeon]
MKKNLLLGITFVLVIIFATSVLAFNWPWERDVRFSSQPSSCSENNKCSLGEGDCDGKDKYCQSGLKCEMNIGSDYNYASWVDVCVTPVDPPATPQNVRVSALSDREIKIEWDAVIGATSYTVYRRDIPLIPYAVVYSNSFIASYLYPDRNYCFRVKAKNDGGISGISSTRCISTLEEFKGPTTLTITSVSNNQIKLDWSDVSGAQGWIIYYRNGTQVANSTTASPSDYTIATPTGKTCYYVRLTKNTGSSIVYSTKSPVKCYNPSTQQTSDGEGETEIPENIRTCISLCQASDINCETTQIPTGSTSGGTTSVSTGSTPSTELVLHLPLNGNANDVSGNSLHGLAIGNVERAQGKIDQAYTFNGDSSNYVKVNDNNLLDFSQRQPFTISAWARTPNPTSNPSVKQIISKGNTGSCEANYGLRTMPSGKIRFSLEGDGCPEDNVFVDSRNAVRANQWFHVVGVYDGNNNLTIYLNGVLSNSSIINASKITTNNQPLYVGWGHNDFPWNGTIDDVRIYNRTLTPAEIKEIYNRYNFPSIPLVPGPQFYLSFDRNRSQTDDSGNNIGIRLGQSNVRTNGIRGQAMGISSINEPISLLNDFHKDRITVAAWVKINQTGRYEHIVTKRTCCDSYDRDNEWTLQTDNRGRYLFSVNVGTERGSTWASSRLGSVTPGQWVHLAGTYDGNKVKLYVNGTLVDERSASGNINIITSPTNVQPKVVIGARMSRDFGTGFDGNMIGLIDEVYIYDRALTPEEIRKLVTIA